MSDRAWLRSVTVCQVHGDTAWYVCYETKTHRLRLTHRGTWSMDDMDIYWKSQAEAFAALHVAPCPLEDPYAKIKALEAEVSRLRSVCERAAFKTLAGMPIVPRVDRETPFAVAEMLYNALKQGKEFVKEEDQKSSDVKAVCMSWMYMNQTGGWFVPTSDAGKEPSDGV